MRVGLSRDSLGHENEGDIAASVMAISRNNITEDKTTVKFEKM